MSAGIGMHRSIVWLIVLTLATAMGCATPAQAPPAKAAGSGGRLGRAPRRLPRRRRLAQASGPPAHDLLNAVLWMQRSVEYKATTLAAFALARHPPRPGAGRSELDGARPEGADRRLPVAAAGGHPGRRRDDPRQLGLPGVDDHEGHDVRSEDVERLREHGDLGGHPGRRRVRPVRAVQGREGLLRLEPHRPRRRRRRGRTSRSSASRVDGAVDTVLMSREQPGLDVRQGHAARLHRPELPRAPEPRRQLRRLRRRVPGHRGRAPGGAGAAPGPLGPRVDHARPTRRTARSSPRRSSTTSRSPPPISARPSATRSSRGRALTKSATGGGRG